MSGYGWFERTLHALIGLTVGTAFYNFTIGKWLYWFSWSVIAWQIVFVFVFIFMFFKTINTMKNRVNKQKNKVDKLLKQLNLPNKEE